MMLGRQVTAALRRPLQARLRAIAPLPTESGLCIRTFSYAPRLLTPTAGRPKKAVGEPSRPVKRAVKAKAKEPATTETDAAAEKLAEKEKAAAKKAAELEKKNKAAAKKLAEKEKAAAKKAAELEKKKKAAAKKLAEKDKAAKKKAAELEKKKKAAAAKKAKPALTPEKIERKEAALRKAAVIDLKKAALEPPARNNTHSAYQLFMKEKGAELRERIASESGSEGKTTTTTVRTQMAEFSKMISEAWKNITPAQLEHYNHLVHTIQEAADAEHKRWVESHDVNEIKIANQARAKLRRTLDPKHSKKWPAIKDERQVKQAAPAFVQFCVSRNASGDFKHIKIPERAKLLSQEWKALSDEEKQKYKNLADRDSERQSSEESSVHSSA